MKINPSLLDALRGTPEATRTPDKTAAKPAPAAPAGGDRVDLSKLSAQIAQLESSLAAEPGFDPARVEAIKQAITDGKLTVNAEVVADRMLASALAMMGSKAN
jgi:negative regulator of flagellin synthesis FlgM